MTSNNSNNNNTTDASSLLPVSTSDLTQAVQIRSSTQEQGQIAPKTIMEHFNATVEQHGHSPALHYKMNKEATEWKVWTWKEYREQADAFGIALIALGCNKFDCVNILGFNSPYWFFANFGSIAAGCVPAGIYTTNQPEACQYISNHSKAKVVVVDGIKQLEKYYSIASSLPNLSAIVMYGNDTLPSDIKEKCSVPCYTWESFIEIGMNSKGQNTQVLSDRTNSWKPTETVTLIYTSGTTGPPKAVMITNDNITWTCRTMLLCSRYQSMNTTDVMISYLPLSHIAAQMLDLHIPMYTGMQIYFAQPDALKGSLGQTLKEVRPTTFFGVPRVWEKIYDKLQEVAKSSTGIKKILSTWAKSKAAEHWAAQEYGSKSTSPFFYFLAKKLLHKAHLALGLDRCYAFYVSAAPIELKVLKYFASIDIPIMELFGQSECTGPHAVNTYTAFKLGTVGRPMLGTETKIDPNTGELLYRGRHIFAGYMGMPDKTKETIDPEGWLHSGDVVSIDEDHTESIPPPSGFVRITGRIKELIITAGGENVPPVLIEDALKGAIPELSNAMVIGDKRKFLSVLLCLQVEIDVDEGIASNKLTGQALETSKALGSTATTTDEVRSDPLWKKYLDEGVQKANAKATSKAQHIAKWALLSTDFTEKGGELTPTLKLKRSVAAEKYNDVIEGLYA